MLLRGNVWLPVKSTLCQNLRQKDQQRKGVWLPVKSTLCQNKQEITNDSVVFDYQSNRHCAKTGASPGRKNHGLITSQIDTVPKPRCLPTFPRLCLITSQIDTVPKRNLRSNVFVRVWLPVKSTLCQNWSTRFSSGCTFDYQSNRHCAKTAPSSVNFRTSLITSQIDTVPKPVFAIG